MLLSPGGNGLDSFFNEVRVMKRRPPNYTEILKDLKYPKRASRVTPGFPPQSDPM